MELLLILLFSLVGVALILLAILLVGQSKSAGVARRVDELRSQIDGLSTRQIEADGRTLRDQNAFYQNTGRMLSDVHRKLGAVEEASRRIQELGKDMMELQDILKPTKARGLFGETLLENLIRQIIPERHFTMQHRFRDGSAADAAIRIGERLVIIDAKFPLEAFQRLSRAQNDEERRAGRKEFRAGLRKRVDEIAGKYIREDEGTYGFALMYVPAEGIYHELISMDDPKDGHNGILDYALEKKVLPVSPNSLYAYLQAVAVGLRGFQIEQQAKVIMAELARIGASYEAFRADFEQLGRHLRNAAGKYDETARKAEKFGERIGEIAGIHADSAAGEAAAKLPAADR